MSKTKHNISFGLIALAVVVAILLVVISFRCGRQFSGNTTIKRDTTVKFYPYYVRDTVLSEPKIIYQKAPVITVPSDCEGLRLSYTDLATNHYTLRALRDTAWSGKSYVVITDTLQQNTLRNRQTYFNIFHEDKETVITNNITEHDGRQVYLGASVGGINQLSGATIGGSVLYKNRKDNITAIAVKIDNTGNYTYELTRYFKISFKRR